MTQGLIGLVFSILTLTGVVIACAGLIYLVFRKSIPVISPVGLAQAALFQSFQHTIQTEMDRLGSELTNVNNSLRDWRAQFLESDERIWKQLRIISANGTVIREIQEDVKHLKSRLSDIEQVVASMSDHPDEAKE